MYGNVRRYLLATLLCGLFAWVYETMSHGVIALPMVLLPLWPLLMGALPAWLLVRLGMPAGPWPRRLWALAVVTLTIASALHGVLAIYGTETDAAMPLYAASTCLVLASLVVFWWENRRFSA